MLTEQPILITSLPVTFNALKNTFVSIEGEAFQGSGGRVLGVITADTNANSNAPVIVSGIALVKTGSAIVKGRPIAHTINGLAAPCAVGDTIAGLSLDSATGAGQLIRILLHAGSIYSE
jgi:hypothetical protein